MPAALISAHLVPIARTDADWAFDIALPNEDWTGSEVSVAFARQGNPATRFEIDTTVPSSDMACAVRVPASFWADKPAGAYTVEVRKITADAIDDAAVFQLMLVAGASDARLPVALPSGSGVATGGVIISRTAAVSVVRGAGGATGRSAYQQAVLEGYEGSQAEYAALPLEAAALAGEKASLAAEAAELAAAATTEAEAATAAAEAVRAEAQALVNDMNFLLAQLGFGPGNLNFTTPLNTGLGLVLGVI